jgi:glutathione S-transferase
MITVHHLNNSRSQRVLWMLEELELPYEITKYQRDSKTMLAPAGLRKIHPLGKSPVITDGSATLAESGAILEYLAHSYGGGRLEPAQGTPEHHFYRYFMHYAEGSLMPLLVVKLIFNKVQADVPMLIRPIARMINQGVSGSFINPNLSTHLGFLDQHLSAHEWFAGAAFSAADVQMSFPLEAAAARAGSGVAQSLLRWLARVHARPAYRRALERGGPFDISSGA